MNLIAGNSSDSSTVLSHIVLHLLDVEKIVVIKDDDFQRIHFVRQSCIRNRHDLCDHMTRWMNRDCVLPPAKNSQSDIIELAFLLIHLSCDCALDYHSNWTDKHRKLTDSFTRALMYRLRRSSDLQCGLCGWHVTKSPRIGPVSTLFSVLSELDVLGWSEKTLYWLLIINSPLNIR